MVMNGPAKGMNRRSLLGGALASGAALALPVKAGARAHGLSPGHAAILDLARREVARAGDRLWNRDLAAIADFGIHSAIPRFHFANLESGTVRSFLVSHGAGSDEEHDGWLKRFSNVEGSNATSRGAYVAWEWYDGQYGTSIRLGGLDPDNSLAEQRAIVMHEARYATPEHVQRWGRLGRSNGCFAMDPRDFRIALWHLAGGRLIFADRLGIAI